MKDDYKHLDREGLMRVLGDSFHSGPSPTEQFWIGVEIAMAWIATFVLGIAAFWVLGAVLGFLFDTTALGFDAGQSLFRSLREIQR